MQMRLLLVALAPLLVLGEVDSDSDSAAAQLMASPSPEPSPSHTYDGDEIHVDYAAVVEGLWELVDEDGSDSLSLEEFESAFEKLGLTGSFLTQHSNSITVFFNAIDSNSDGEVTIDDFAGAIDDFPSYSDTLKAAISNGAGEMPSSMEEIAPLPTSDVKNAEVTVTVTMTVSGSPDDIFPGQRDMILDYFSDLLSVPTTSIFLTFLPVGERRKLMEKMLTKIPLPTSHRHLQAAAETEIVALAYMETVEDAEAAAANVPTSTSAFANVPAFSGLEVTGIEPVHMVKPVVLPIPAVAGVGAVLIICALFFIINAMFWSSKKGGGGGCCASGCCSVNAIKAWAFAEFMSGCIILGCVFYLYTNMQGVTDVILGIIDTIITFRDESATMEFLGDMVSEMPDEIIDSMEERKSLVELLPFAVMGPGVVAALGLLAASFCAVQKVHAGSWCFTKILILISSLFLLVALIFYSIFGAFGVIMAYPTPELKEQLGTLRMCDTIPSALAQTVSDNTLMIAKLSDAGQDISELQDTLDDITTLVGLVDDGCGHILSLVDEMVLLFQPGIMCVVAILLAFVTNFTLCCAAGCTSSPAPAMSKPTASV